MRASVLEGIGTVDLKIDYAKQNHKHTEKNFYYSFKCYYICAVTLEGNKDKKKIIFFLGDSIQRGVTSHSILF